MSLFEGIDRLEGYGSSEWDDWKELYYTLLSIQTQNTIENMIDYNERVGLSDDATFVIELVLNTPSSLIKKVKKKKKSIRLTMNDIRKFLLNKGWSNYRINRLFTEVVEFIRK